MTRRPTDDSGTGELMARVSRMRRDDLERMVFEQLLAEISAGRSSTAEATIHDRIDAAEAYGRSFRASLKTAFRRAS